MSPTPTQEPALKLFAFRLLAAAVLLTAAAAHAQLPTDSQPWKDRCNLMSSEAAAIRTGRVPTMFTSATRGVPSHSFLVLAVNRAQNGQHYLACTLYYMAAVADRAGNGSAPNAEQAFDEAIIGGSELKLAHHRHLNMTEHEKRIKFKVEEMTGAPLSLTPDQTQAAVDAASTMPLTM
jgi:hypothetical protein